MTLAEVLGQIRRLFPHADVHVSLGLWLPAAKGALCATRWALWMPDGHFAAEAPTLQGLADAADQLWASSEYRDSRIKAAQARGTANAVNARLVQSVSEAVEIIRELPEVFDANC